MRSAGITKDMIAAVVVRAPTGYGEKKEYGSENFYPEHKTQYTNYELVQENGKTILRIPYEDDSTLAFERTSSPQ